MTSQASWRFSPSLSSSITMTLWSLWEVGSTTPQSEMTVRRESECDCNTRGAIVTTYHNGRLPCCSWTARSSGKGRSSSIWRSGSDWSASASFDRGDQSKQDLMDWKRTCECEEKVPGYLCWSMVVHAMSCHHLCIVGMTRYRACLQALILFL